MTNDLEINPRWDAASALHKGHVRQENQDAVLIRSDLGLWVVADGMGGHRNGAVASQRVVDRLDAMDWEPDLGLDQRLTSVVAALKEVNHELYISSLGNEGGVCGSTVAVMLAWQQKGAVVWAGDSRVYRRHGQQLLALTRDHSQVEEMIGNGLLQREQAQDHPAASIVTRAIGATAICEPDQKHFEINSEDTFLLCSDGLYNEVSSTSIIAALATGSSAHSANTLYELTLRSPARDNFSLIVARMQNLDDSKTALNPSLAI